jgi:hypothetical protein
MGKLKRKTWRTLDGYAIQKFRNVDVNGKQGSDKTGISQMLIFYFPFSGCLFNVCRMCCKRCG